MNNLTIQIPPPPEGYGEVEFRLQHPQHDELVWTGSEWVRSPGSLIWHYPIARKLPPPYEPPQELEVALINIFGGGWLLFLPSTKNVYFSKQKPKILPECRKENIFWQLGKDHWKLPSSLFPQELTHTACFKIGITE
jgi:hypothetical protein